MKMSEYDVYVAWAAIFSQRSQCHQPKSMKSKKRCSVCDKLDRAVETYVGFQDFKRLIEKTDVITRIKIYKPQVYSIMSEEELIMFDETFSKKELAAHNVFL